MIDFFSFVVYNLAVSISRADRIEIAPVGSYIAIHFLTFPALHYLTLFLKPKVKMAKISTILCKFAYKGLL